jgi:uncharacterized protein (DUF2141 family)
MRKLLLSALVLAASPSVSAADRALLVTISDIRHPGGHLLVSVESSAEGWNAEGKSVAVARIAARAGEVVQRFDDLPPGHYAVQVMHDENDNGKLDSNFLGIPSEGYGFSQNPGVMRRATFEEARFELPAEGAEIVVRLR